ncbi:gliding motility lipoprotein GldD [Flavobacterium sp. SM2513]|uniref:gliding motility lipoprotein GldD n=1 Tax=Flavobacterium sp. SM2513 TaxID=3424766 RepID=UPI003D7F34C4
MKHKFLLFWLLAVGLFVFSSCKEDVLPKPMANLRLDYSEATYRTFDDPSCPFTFEVNSDGKIKQEKNCNLSVHYPKMKATIYFTLKPVNNNIDLLLRDAQKLTYEHVVKADDIIEQPFINKKDNVYGMFYAVNGNAATNAQFYLTDSTRYFVDCSVYFYAKPNFDSIMPAASYLRNDLQNMMESFRWKK